jgi:hypothetical protein
VNGVAVQVGPRSVGRRCAAWGLAIARDRFLVITAVVTVAISVVLSAGIIVAVMAAQGRFSQPAPVYVPRAFCPAGQHVTGTSESGWPDCAANH